MQQSTIEPTRVAILDHTARMGGGEVALLNLAKAIDPVRYKVIVVLFSDGPLQEKLAAAGIQTQIVQLDPSVSDARKDAMGGKSLLRLAQICSALKFVWTLRAQLKSLNVRLVHTNSLKSDILGGLAGRLSGIPVIWHVRDRIASDYLPAPVAAMFRLLARVIPTKVIAISHSVLNTLRLRNQTEDSPWKTARFEVVHDGTEVCLAAQASPTPSNPIVGLIGRISPWKGQHIFLKAVSLIRDRFPTARFWIIGSALFSEEEYEREIHQLCMSLGLADVVEFAGFREDVPAVLAQLDLLVHASTKGEPFGQVILEGMAAGKAVVATRGGGVPEFVKDGTTGLLVPMDDAPAMATAMARLLGGPALRQQMGQQARQSVIDGFTITHTAQKVQALYDRMLYKDQ